jgi:hypothetical protein
MESSVEWKSVRELRVGEDGDDTLPYVPKAKTCLKRSLGFQLPSSSIRKSNHFSGKAFSYVLFQIDFQRNQASLLV